MRSARLAVVLALSTALPAQAAVKDSSPSGFTLENSEVVPVDARTAWKGLVEDVGRIP